MRFEAKAPFKIISTEPPSPAKTSKTQTPGSITVKPAKTLEVSKLIPVICKNGNINLTQFGLS